MIVSISLNNQRVICTFWGEFSAVQGGRFGWAVVAAPAECQAPPPIRIRFPSTLVVRSSLLLLLFTWAEVLQVCTGLDFIIIFFLLFSETTFCEGTSVKNHETTTGPKQSVTYPIILPSPNSFHSVAVSGPYKQSLVHQMNFNYSN